MGDFLLDLRSRENRAWKPAAEFLRFYDDMRVDVVDAEEFTLVLTSADEGALWGPYASPDGELTVGLCGRIALDDEDWERARRVAGPGGLACKAIATLYRGGRVREIEQLGGNFAIFIYDRKRREFLMILDCAGILPAFCCEGEKPLIYASHPDAIARVAGDAVAGRDEVSLAEFALTGKVTAPHTYYRKIKAVDYGSTTVLKLLPGAPQFTAQSRHIRGEAAPAAISSEAELVEELAVALRRAVRRRTSPRLGRTAVALSGGLDSRTILCASENRQGLVGFCCYDEENLEFRTARAIAAAAGVEFVPLRRQFDHYADHAPMGVRIAGGMGCFASNHFLGFRARLRDLGVQNLLTGCYCDYLFKGLAINKRVNRWTLRERLAPYQHAHYFRHFDASTPLAAQVRERLDSVFPVASRQSLTDQGILEIEKRRVFPLCYEGDNVQRLVAQRVLGWYLPVAEPGLMEIHRKTPPALKLNRSLFSRAAQRVCGPEVAGIPDANTGAAMNAGWFSEMLHSYWLKLDNRFRWRGNSHATNGSWPNWQSYLHTSDKIRALWLRPNPEAWDFFRGVLGDKGFATDIRGYAGARIDLFMQLFTLKLWLDQRS